MIECSNENLVKVIYKPINLTPISKYKDFDYKNCSLDAMDNIVSLCSHCHNLLHYGKYEDKNHS